MPQNHIQEHIELIAKHEEDFLAQRTQAERMGDSIAAFAGSIRFVVLHVLFFFAWIGWNTILPVRHFDPFPFAMLDTVVALEAILLASFILMRQARTARRSDERDHLMLQILLLTEKEITAVLGVDRQIAKQVGLDKVANSTEIRELSQQTSIDDVAQTIKESLPMAE